MLLSELLTAIEPIEVIGCTDKEIVAELQQNTHAVAGRTVGVFAGSVLKLLHDAERTIYSLVRFFARDIHDRADAARVVLCIGVKIVIPVFLHKTPSCRYSGSNLSLTNEHLSTQKIKY